MADDGLSAAVAGPEEGSAGATRGGSDDGPWIAFGIVAGIVVVGAVVGIALAVTLGAPSLANVGAPESF